MQKIELDPIGKVVSTIAGQRDEHWGSVTAEIHLDAARFHPEALMGLEEFSHVEILFALDQVPDDKIETGLRHPRENPRWPRIGIFAQRGRSRPNRIGVTICEIVCVNGLALTVRGLDAFDGSPVLDIKPVMAEFLPDKTALHQPQWAKELMSTYF